MAHISVPDPERPFGITRRIAELTMVLARAGYKFSTPKAVETAYKTLLFYEMRENLAKLRLKSGYGIWELVDY